VTGFILTIFAVIRAFFRSQNDTAFEVAALRQLVAILKRQRPRLRLARELDLPENSRLLPHAERFGIVDASACREPLIHSDS
jgi:hypothetical protein